MEISYNNNEFNTYIANHPLGTITQSSHWAVLQENVPTRGKTYQFVVTENKNIIGACSLIVHKLDAPDVIGNNPMLKKIFKNKSYLYAHRGPVFDNEKSFQAILDECKKIAQKENSITIRFDPPLDYNVEKSYYTECKNQETIYNISNQEKFFNKYNFQKAHAQYQPMSSLIVDLQSSEEDILAQMSQTGRRNIRKAEKSELTLDWTDNSDSEEFDQFIKIMDETTSRDGFTGHHRDYYERIINILGKQEQHARLYYAKYQNQLLAAFIVTYFGHTATYYYGASSNNERQRMAPFGLHWYIMKEMKNLGYKYYDFLGIAPFYWQSGQLWKIQDEEGIHHFKSERKAINYVENIHRFHNITKNKTRFGGYRIDFPPAHEYIVSHKWYYLLISLKTIRKWIRKIGLKI